MRKVLFTIVVFAFAFFAQESPKTKTVQGEFPKGTTDSQSFVIENEDVIFPFDNKGVIGDVQGAGVKFDSLGVIYSAGFAVSGYTDAALWANAVITSSRLKDYIPGNVGDSEGGEIYVVRSSDPPFGESWQIWSEAVNKGAKFYDGDGDGVYNPVDLNGNGVWDATEDAPDLAGDVVAWCVYNDGVPAEQRTFTDMQPQGIEIRQTVWTNLTIPELQNVFFIRYSLYNTGSVAESFSDVYFSIITDADIGNYADDLAGSKPSLETAYTYGRGEDALFGESIPTVMTTFLGAVKSINGEKIVYDDYNNSFIQYMQSHPVLGDPNNAVELRNLMLGKKNNGDFVDPCSWEYGEVFNNDCSTIDGRWMYSGNPIDSIGWLNTFPTDQRTMFNIGPFDINSGESIDITVAYHFSRGETGLQSVALGLAKAEYLISHAGILGIDDRDETPKEFSLSQNYPNPFNPTTTIKYAVPKTSLITLKIYDVLGREIETLVNNVQNPGIYSVQFDAAKLSSGVYFYTLQAGDFVITKKMILAK